MAQLTEPWAGNGWLLQHIIHKARQTVGFVILHFILPTMSIGCCNQSCCYCCCRVESKKKKKQTKDGTAEASAAAMNMHSGAV